jgi:hypothetical protein
MLRTCSTWSRKERESDGWLLCWQFDSIIQDMLCRYLVGFSWKEIGKVHGLSAHAAEARFSHAMQQAHERLKI